MTRRVGRVLSRHWRVSSTIRRWGHRVTYAGREGPSERGPASSRPAISLAFGLALTAPAVASGDGACLSVTAVPVNLADPLRIDIEWEWSTGGSSGHATTGHNHLPSSSDRIVFTLTQTDPAETRASGTVAIDAVYVNRNLVTSRQIVVTDDGKVKVQSGRTYELSSEVRWPRGTGGCGSPAPQTVLVRAGAIEHDLDAAGNPIDDEEDDGDEDDGGDDNGDDEDDGGDEEDDGDDDNGDPGGPSPVDNPEDEEAGCTLVAPYWSGPTGGFTARPLEGRTSVSVTCGVRTTEFEAENGLVTRLLRSACRSAGLRLEGAAPGAWYWQHGDRNAAVAPFVCSEDLGGPRALVPGGVTSEATDNGTVMRHDTARLVGIVPHLANNDCGEYVTPYWQGDGGVVVRPAEGRDTVRVRVHCGVTRSTMTVRPGADGVAAELVRKSWCTDAEGSPKQGQLTVTGAAPGGWYWVSGERNAAVAPLVCSDLLGSDRAVDPGGLTVRRTGNGTWFAHPVEKLIGVVPHLGEMSDSQP